MTMVRWRPLVFVAACAIAVAFGFDALAQNAAQAQAARLRAEAEALSGYEAALQPDAPDAAVLISRIRGALRSPAARADPILRGNLHISLALALEAEGQDQGTPWSRASFATLDEALRTLTRENAPFEWARAHQIRSQWLLETTSDGATVNAAASRESADLALSVFTKEADPFRYLQLRCMQALFAPGMVLDEGDFTGEATARYEALSPACPMEMMSGDQVGRDTRLRRMMRAAPYQMLMMRAQFELMGGGYADMLNASPELSAMTSGAGLVDSLEDMRAKFLSASLALDSFALPEADARRVRALRALADERVSAAQNPAQLRADQTLWRAYADVFDILIDARPQPQFTAGALQEPVLGMMMISAQSGAVAAKPVNGVGDTAMTPELSNALLSAMFGRDAATYFANMQALQSGSRREHRRAMEAMGDFDQMDATQGLDRFVQATVNTSARAWMRDYAGGDFVAAIDNFRAAFEPTWGVLLREAAVMARAQPGQRLLILPDGASSMLPISLLRDPRTGRALMDDFEIAFVPSLSVYDALRVRAVMRRAPSLAAFAPTAEASGLAFVDSELSMARRAFGGARTIPPAASKVEILQALRGASYWHFATHGAFEPAAPRQSWLELGAGVHLTLNDLYASETALGAPRLVVLSACETGVFDAARDPDEFIGLPTGFLQAGAAGVIASLWQVSDVSSTLLMGKFYDLHIGAGERPSAALRHAQLWLRDADRASLEAFVQDQAQRGALSAAQARDLQAAIREERDQRPFSHPYYWGAFVYYGA